MANSVLEFLSGFVTQIAKVLSFGAGIQNSEREKLVVAIQGICDRSEVAYAQLLARLRPVKDAYFDRTALALNLRAFAADPVTRDLFKPDRLCGEASVILDSLRNNLDPLKYSVDVRRVEALRGRMQEFGNYDRAFFESFDAFAKDLDDIATTLSDPTLTDANERMTYARRIVGDFEEDIRSTLRHVHEARTALLDA